MFVEEIVALLVPCCIALYVVLSYITYKNRRNS